MVVLDTHAWIWWFLARDRLGDAAREAIEAGDRVIISAISCFEVAWLEQRQRVRLDGDTDSWIARAAVEIEARIEDVSPEIALAAAQLDRRRFPSDPADRIIYATAVRSHAKLITRDAAIARFDPERAVWD